LTWTPYSSQVLFHFLWRQILLSITSLYLFVFSSSSYFPLQLLRQYSHVYTYTRLEVSIWAFTCIFCSSYAQGYSNRRKWKKMPILKYILIYTCKSAERIILSSNRWKYVDHCDRIINKYLLVSMPDRTKSWTYFM